MPNQEIKVFLIDQDSNDVTLFKKTLAAISLPSFKFIFQTQESLQASLDYLNQNKVDIIFINLALPDGQGFEIIQKIRETAVTVPLIVITEHDDETLGREVIRQGAQDYLVKGSVHAKMLSRIILYSIERKRLEEALRLQSQIVANMAEGVCFIRSSDATLVYTNPTFEAMFGYLPGELSHKPISMLNAPSFEKSAQARSQEIVAHLKKHGRWSGEVHNLKKDGSSFWCQANISTFNHPEYGTIWVTVHTDITKRKLAEETLMRTASELQAIFQAFPDLYFRLNADGTILDYHAGQPKDLFLSPDEFLGRTIQEVLPRAVGQQFEEMIAHVSQKRSTASMEYALSLEEEEQYFEARALPLLENKILIIVRNITERKKLEKVKDEFISTVSHELRTPLSIIKEAVSNLKDGLAGPLTKEQTEVIDIANRNAYRLSRIINDILDLSRLQSGKAKIHPITVDMAQLIEETIQNFKTITQAKKIHLKIETPKTLPPILCDGSLIERVLSNLLDNAIRFSKSEVVVKAVLIQQMTSFEDKKQNVAQDDLAITPALIQITVCDDGPGIAKEDIKSLFNKFHQIHRPMGGTGYKGTGIGLVISKEIIELHRGKISVESVLGKGSQFHFSLPVTLQENPA